MSSYKKIEPRCVFSLTHLLKGSKQKTHEKYSLKFSNINKTKVCLAISMSPVSSTNKNRPLPSQLPGEKGHSSPVSGLGEPKGAGASPCPKDKTVSSHSHVHKL